MKMTTGKINRAQRIGFYGPEGIGKSTLASRFENPLFMDLESGTDQMNVRRISGFESWEELLEAVQVVSADPEICRTLVIDTADRAEQLCIAAVCRKYRQEGLESFGYGRGYTYVAEAWGQLLNALDAVIAAGVNVILIAHARQRKVELPDQAGSFDHWEMKLTKLVAPMVKEWVDMLLFMNFQTEGIMTEDNTRKTAGGARKMYTSHTPSFDAKNRHGLKEVMDLDYGAIAHLFRDRTVVSSALAELRQRMAEAGVTEEQVRKVVAERGHYEVEVPMAEYNEEFLTGWCVKYWEQILNAIRENEKKGDRK